MILVLLLALALVGATVVLVLRAGGIGDPHRKQALEHIGAYGFNADVAQGGPGPTPRQRLSSFATAIGETYVRF